MTEQRTSRLRVRYPHESPQTMYASVIAVPGIGTPSPDSWFDGPSGPWLSFLPDGVLPSPAVYDFDHRLSINQESRLWKDVLSKGLELLEALVVLLKHEKFEKCAIVFITHSLGGIMVKQCITMALERKRDFREVSRNTAGLIAMATPHSKSERVEDWNQPQLLVGARNRVRRGIATTSEEARQLASLCLRFEQVVPDFPILTLCETKETAIKSLFAGRSKIIIVPKSACEVQSRLEEFHEINSNHMEICTNIPRLAMKLYIERAVHATSLRIIRELEEHPAPPVLSETVVANRDASDIIWTESQTIKSDNTSNQATLAISDTRQEGPTTPLSDFSVFKRDACLPCHVLPMPRNPQFYGRSEVIDRIEECLAPSVSSASPTGAITKERSFALCAAGGMGKTQTANEFAQTHLDMFEAIFWVHAEDVTTLSDDFSRIAEHLGLVLQGSVDARDQVVTRELVKGWLTNPKRSHGRGGIHSDEEVPWLLIFDNVKTADILSDFWPAVCSSGSILITSRDPLAKTPFYQVAAGMDLPPLNNIDAAELLLQLTWREEDINERKLSTIIAEKLGGLPLAITQMAGVMVRQDISFAAFLGRYEEEETHGDLFSLSLEPNYKRSTYGHTLASVWSLEALEYSSGLLDVMSFLDPDGIAEKLLLSMVGELLLSDYPQTVKGYYEARTELLTSSLVGRDRYASSLTIHRMIQDTVRAKMKPDRLTTVFSAAIDLLLSLWTPADPGDRHHVARWKECETLAPHMKRLKEHYVRANKASKPRWRGNLPFATLLNELGWYLQERAQTNEALDCFRIAQIDVEYIISTHDGRSDDSTYKSKPLDEKVNDLMAELHRNIAGSAHNLNDAETASKHFQIYNNMLKERYIGVTVVPDSRLTSSFFNVGLCYTMKGKYDEAIIWYTQALIEAERLPDPIKIKGARSLALTNLGLTYWLMDLLGDALEVLTTALREREEIVGPNDRQSMITGRILHCLGNVRNSEQLLEQSLQLHERALQHFKETVGNNHHRTGNSCFKVAEHYVRLERWHESIMLLDQALKVFADVRCYAGEAARVKLLKSVALKHQEKLVESAGCLHEAHRLYRTVCKIDTDEEDLTIEDINKYVHVWGR